MKADWYRWDNKDLLLSLTVQAKSSKDELVGEHNGRCKVRITAPPVDGKANRQLVKYLAKLFRVSKGQVVIEKGTTNKHKQVRIVRAGALPAELKVSDQ